MLLSRTKAKTLKRRLRTFTGEDLGTPLIAYLERTDRPTDDSVEKLVELMGRLRSGEDTRDEMVDLINQTVKNRPELWMMPVASRTPEGMVTVTDGPVSSGPVPRMIATLLVEWNRALVLLKRGLLDRIRRCAKADCGKLFWARFSHSEYHADACRLAVEAANPEYKKNRREYMRRQRKAQKRKKS